MQNKEATARIKFNKFPEDTGWLFFADTNRGLITCFEHKISPPLARIWGETAPASLLL
jgi:hypothetical protein